MHLMQENFAPYAAPENVLRVLEKVHANGLRGKIDLPFLTRNWDWGGQF